MFFCEATIHLRGWCSRAPFGDSRWPYCRLARWTAQQYRLPGSNNYPPGGQMMQGQMGMGQMAMGQMGLGQMAQRPMPQNGPIQQASMPVNMASPLAGGPAAAQGNQFTDVYGNPIVMQTSYLPIGT